jgi:hypothetical protein
VTIRIPSAENTTSSKPLRMSPAVKVATNEAPSATIPQTLTVPSPLAVAIRRESGLQLTPSTPAP